jgi:hypothetical protein
MSIISATRRGFLYQDRFAVAIYLEQLQARNVKEYFIDFPMGARKSLDIRYTDSHNDEAIYEVKSGEEFKRDARRKESSEVRDALINLKEYLDLKPSAKLNLIIRRGFVGNITTYWDKLTFVRTHAFQNSTREINWLHGKLRLPGITTPRALFDFCQRITIDDFGDDELSNEGDHFPDIDDFVLQKINDLSVTFTANACNFEYPAQILMHDLYHQCRLYAGLGQDVNPIFTNAIAEFIAHRKFLDANYTAGPNRNRTKEDLRREVNQEIENYLRGTTSVAPQIVQTPQYTPEGGTTPT